MTNQRRFHKTLGALLTALAVWSALSITPAAAQGQPVRFLGRVSWVAGQTLVVSTDDNPGVHVDLRQVDQAEYQRLARGDFVIVIGTLPFAGNRVLATSILATSIAPQSP